MKDDILHSFKSEMTSIVNCITFENLDEQYDLIRSYYDYLKMLKDLPVMPRAIPSESLSAIAEIKFTPETRPALTLTTIEKGQKQIVEEIAYLFERKLRGGRIPGLDGGYPVSERVVRELNLKHGDQLSIIDSKQNEFGTKYFFNVVEKSVSDEPKGRVQENFCIIEKDKGLGGSLVINRNTLGLMKLNNVPYTFVVDEKDELDHNLCEGDIVDIAYYDNNPQNFRIIWKHQSSSTKTSPKSRSSTSKIKTSVDDDEPVKTFPIDYELIKGKTLTIVGFESMKSRYQRVCEQLGINLNHLTGDERSGFESAIKVSDAVIFITTHAGHKGEARTKEVCKSLNVPFIPVDRGGIQQVLIEFEKTVKIRFVSEASQVG